MRISGQGRITIPKPLRDRLGLDCGVEVEITPYDGGVLIRKRDAAGDVVQAALGGRLREVDPKQRTAQLHEYGPPGHIPLRFGPDLDAEMRRLETQYVEVRGTGRIDDDRDRWIEVWVEELRETRSWRELFDLKAFLEDPNPRLLDPHRVPALNLSDDEWEAFDRAIREGREA